MLLDKDGLLARTLPSLTQPAPPVTAHAYAETVADFWYHALWAARKLARGEIFVAKACVDGYMKDLLMRMLRWHCAGRETWHGSRFLQEWADPRALADLRGAYARYDANDVARALQATLDFFAWVARETAERLDYFYAETEEALSRYLVNRVISSR